VPEITEYPLYRPFPSIKQFYAWQVKMFCKQTFYQKHAQSSLKKKHTGIEENEMTGNNQSNFHRKYSRGHV
jgi:hypothetical protein